jgi:four helix bundle protein
METKYDYKQLEVYKEAKILVKMVYKLLEKFPKQEQYALCDQLRRAVISVPSNIAEGLGRYSSKEQIHFFEIAYGSLREVDCQMDIAQDLEYISEEDVCKIIEQIRLVSALISGLRSKRMNTSNPLNSNL